MSLSSWKKEFYPCEANSKEALKDPLKHSLRKWQGLTKKNLKKHGMKWDECGDRVIFDKDGEDFWVNGHSCACCRKVNDDCGKCVISARCEDAYIEPIENQDPRPILNLLKKAIRERGKR